MSASPACCRRRFAGRAVYAPEVWLPLADRSLFGLQAAFEARDARLLFLMARLAHCVNAPEVQARLDAAAADMAREWPETHRGRTALFRSFGDGNAELERFGRLRRS